MARMGRRLTETELGLQDTVLSLAVLAGVGAVESLVGAHEGGSASLDGVGEGPKVELVDGLVVSVARIVRARGTVGLLLIHQEMASNSNNTSAVHAGDRFFHDGTTQVRIRGEAFRQTATIWCSSERTSNRTWRSQTGGKKQRIVMAYR